MDENTQKILIYSEFCRNLTEVQEQYINYIANELLKLYPDLSDWRNPSSAEDWAYDIINADNNEDVLKTLQRLETLLKESKNWDVRVGQSQPSLIEDQTDRIESLTDRIDFLEDQIRRLNEKTFYSQ